MVDISVKYLGLELKSPFIAASSGYTYDLEKIVALAKSGVGAIVLKSLFEEQISNEISFLEEVSADYTENQDFLQHYVKDHSLGNYVQLIADAGAEYIYPQNNSSESVAISLEQALLLASTADVWINLGQISTIAQLKAENPKFATVPAVVNGRVYNNTKRTTPYGGSDFWESGAVRPDIILEDLIKILHYEAPTDSLYYYTKIE